MIQFGDIDKRLDSLGKDRKWLSEASGKKPDTIRGALAGGAPEFKRSTSLQKALSDAIEREAQAQAATLGPPQPGFQNVFLSDEQLVRADLASRQTRAASLVEFCRDAILHRANELLAGREDPVPTPHPPLETVESPAEKQSAPETHARAR